jgi:hypothetical protein
VLALIGAAGVMLGLITAMRSLLTRRPIQDEHSSGEYKEDPVALLLIIILIMATLVLGIFPQPVSNVALQMAQGFTFFHN